MLSHYTAEAHYLSETVLLVKQLLTFTYGLHTLAVLDLSLRASITETEIEGLTVSKLLSEGIER